MKPGTSQDTSWTWLQRAQGLKHEAVKLQGPGPKMLKLATRSSVQTVEKKTSRAHMHKGAIQQLTEKHQGARRGRTGPKWAWADWPRPAGPACSEPGLHPPFALGACLFIATSFAGRHIHPFIREPPRRRRSTGRKLMAAASPQVA
jgi:hypothetical protein